jgi:hypothetical protein
MSENVSPATAGVPSISAGQLGLDAHRGSVIVL